MCVVYLEGVGLVEGLLVVAEGVEGLVIGGLVPATHIPFHSITHEHTAPPGTRSSSALSSTLVVMRAREACAKASGRTSGTTRGCRR